jgi:hypothetical protein
MRQSETVRGSAEEGDEQSRRRSWSDAAHTSHSLLRTLERHRPTANFPKMGIAKYRPIPREPKDGTIAQNGPLATSHSPLIIRISNRELLGLEILQLAENKHPRPVLIANFEPNHFVVFQAGHSK